jgi:thioredoxin
MKFSLLFLLLLPIAILSCTGQASKNIKTLEAKDFAAIINTTQNPQILDVRTPEEFAEEHIEKAANVNWLGDHFVVDAEKFNKSKPVFVYCKSGARTKKATEKLVQLGFKNIYELEGGFLKWSAAGLAKPSDKMIGMSSKEYDALLNTGKKVLIDFNAKWCAPCKKMDPFLKKLQTELAQSVVIIRLDADANKTLVKAMKINELPTLLFYENKEVKWKHTGFISEKDLRTQLQ